MGQDSIAEAETAIAERPADRSRLGNLPGPVALQRMMAAMLTLGGNSFAQPPGRLVLDIDDPEGRTEAENPIKLAWPSG